VKVRLCSSLRSVQFDERSWGEGVGRLVILEVSQQYTGLRAYAGQAGCESPGRVGIQKEKTSQRGEDCKRPQAPAAGTFVFVDISLSLI
jgi:hypothetical protein